MLKKLLRSRTLKLVLLAVAVLGLGFAFVLKTTPVATTESVSEEPVDALSASEVPRNSLVDGVVSTLGREAIARRQDRSQNDPNFLKRIDPDILEGRVNVLLYGYGETHEPPLTERALIGSITVASIDLASRNVSLISFTHDIRAPEIERYQAAKASFDGYPIKMYRAYPIGGFDLMRQTVEDATGLPIDFQIAFSESMIAEIVDKVFGGITVNVPADFEVDPFYLDSVKYSGRKFSRGEQVMDGSTVIQFIKTVPIADPGAKYYGRALEHNARKYLVFQGMAKWLKENTRGPGFYLSFVRLLTENRSSGNIDFDFEPESVFIHNLGGMATIMKSFFFNSGDSLPDISKSLYVVDPAHGDGGVQWVNASQAPAIKAEIAAGKYPDRAIEVPMNANPNGDLTKDYWTSVRSLVKKMLLG
jgi:anionic cell wall polymer biosynthesis LytR-Cps2A-Psr (LCP) family protein